MTVLCVFVADDNISNTDKFKLGMNKHWIQEYIMMEEYNNCKNEPH